VLSLIGDSLVANFTKLSFCANNGLLKVKQANNNKKARDILFKLFILKN
jgi:hypothetical protein